MFETATAFFVSIVIAGTPVAQIGPLPDGGACLGMQLEITRDIENDFQPYLGDMWGIPQIVRLQDYEISCMSQTIDMKTGEVVSNQFFD